MEKLGFWGICQELTIAQAALLLCDEDPSSRADDVTSSEISRHPEGYEAARIALSQAIERGEIVANIAKTSNWDPTQDVYGFGSELDPFASTVNVLSLRNWLKKKGIVCEAFQAEVIPLESEPHQVLQPYLDTNHPRYSKKLAAAVKAWMATETAPRGTVKRSLTRWLEHHAKELGLVDKAGRFNKQGLEEVAKVANWDSRGGAPKTP